MSHVPRRDALLLTQRLAESAQQAQRASGSAQPQAIDMLEAGSVIARDQVWLEPDSTSYPEAPISANNRVA